MAHLQDLLIRLEPILLLVAGITFIRSGSANRYPALSTYFVVRGISLFLQDIFLLSGSTPAIGTFRYTAYFYSYWVSYLITAIAIFFVIQEIFRKVMEPVPGLRRLGLLAFRWITIVSIVVSLGAVALPAGAAYRMPYLCETLSLSVMRCGSILELCLLAFLALSIHTLGRSFRSRLFGVALGFGVQASAELVGSALLAKHPAMNSSVNLFLQIVITMVLITWTSYFLVPEPEAERSMIVLPPASALARWNALAKGIGQMPQAATAAPATGFFLQDIEGVVDRVLARNPVIARQ
jgi:hypothetical protein